MAWSTQWLPGETVNGIHFEPWVDNADDANGAATADDDDNMLRHEHIERALFLATGSLRAQSIQGAMSVRH